MRNLIRDVLLEMELADLATPPQPKSSLKTFQTAYFDKYRLLTLCKKHLESKGFAKDGNRQGNVSTKEALLMSIRKDMQLSRVKPDMEFCDDFFDHLKNEALFIMNPIKNAKLESILRSPKVKFGYIDDIIDGVSAYIRVNRKFHSDQVDTGKLVLFNKLKLKGVAKKGTIHRSHTEDRYEFQDQAGNFYISHIRPPMWAKVQDGSGNVLSKLPYELRVNDLFTFRGVVGKSYIYKDNATNVITSIRRA